MEYIIIELSLEGGKRYYFNQRTTVAKRELAHHFPSLQLAEFSFKKSCFKELPHTYLCQKEEE